MWRLLASLREQYLPHIKDVKRVYIVNSSVTIGTTLLVNTLMITYFSLLSSHFPNSGNIRYEPYDKQALSRLLPPQNMKHCIRTSATKSCIRLIQYLGFVLVFERFFEDRAQWLL